MLASSTLLVLALASAAYGSPSVRIVGGSTAYEGQFPYQVAIYQGRLDHCSGSILNQQYILTAAKCIFGRQAKDIRVMYGSNRIRDPNATYVDADEFIPHPLYVDHNFNFNIGLIKLKEQIVLGPKVKAIKLPTSDDLNSTYPAIGSGWGRFHHNLDIYPSHLQFLSLNVIPHSECTAKHINATRSHICASTDIGKGLCRNDEGGPLVAGNVQVGIFSHGRSCSSGYPYVYTRVYRYLDWIEKNSKQ